MKKLIDANATQLGTITLFCKAAELGSFTAAAHQLGLTPAAVSRGVGRLEDRLSVKLFARTTRTMQLTPDGKTYYEQCRLALTQIEDAERFITGRQLQPKGKLRISVPTTYGHYRLLPRLPAFAKLHPDIELDINVSNRNIDFVEEGYEVVIRLGTPPDSRLVAHKLEDAKVGLFASPDYIKANGQPKTLDDLASAKFRTLPFILPSTGKVLPWIFQQNDKPIERVPISNINVSEDPLASVTLARAGAGIVQTFEWIALTHGAELEEVLKPYGGRSRPFYLLYPQNRHLSARVRALIKFLAK
jgi:DNA-binding transcriptional LysR family regulator